MDVPVLSKVLDEASNLGYLAALWLLAALFGRNGDGGGPGAASGGADDERDRSLTVRTTAPQTTVVVVTAGEGADHVVVSVEATEPGTDETVAGQHRSEAA